MAGSFPDAPGPLVAYDRDGTEVYTYVDNSYPVTGPRSDLDVLMEGSNGPLWLGGGSQRTNYLAFRFPVPLSIVGAYVQLSDTPQSSRTIDVHSSDDSTDAIDGTWDSQGTITESTVGAGNRRTTIRSLSIATDEWLRFSFTNGSTNFRNWYRILLFGQPQTNDHDQLRIWHPTLDEPLPAAGLDFGDVARGSSDTLTFRVKNTSASDTANTVTVGLSGYADYNTDLPAALTFSADDTTYTATVSAGNLSAGSISPVLYCRASLPSGFTMTPGIQIVEAEAASWT